MKGRDAAKWTGYEKLARPGRTLDRNTQDVKMPIPINMDVGAKPVGTGGGRGDLGPCGEKRRWS